MRLTAAAAALMIAGLMIAGLTAAPVDAEPTGLGDVLSATVADNGLAGAVAVTGTGGAVTMTTAGFADVPTARPFAPQTHVRVASITKTYVAATVLQLVTEGRVNLDAPVETYLPGMLRGDGIDGHSITVRQLLRHQSGLPEYFDEHTAPVDGPVSPRELLARALSKPGAAPGGAAAGYVNTNYVVAGLILEAVTGAPAADEITRRIIVPLGLAHTYFPAPDDTWLRNPMAHGYELVDGRRRDVTAQETTGEYMAGSLISTNEDSAAFITALLDGRVVAPAQLAQMTDTVEWPRHGPGFRYGLGLTSVDLDCGVRVWGHGGDLAGYHSIMVKAPGGPALAATFTQGMPNPGSVADDPRPALMEALYCPG